MPRAKATKPARGKRHRWVAQVKTDSTHPPAGLFTKDPATIARVTGGVNALTARFPVYK